MKGGLLPSKNPSYSPRTFLSRVCFTVRFFGGVWGRYAVRFATETTPAEESLGFPREGCFEKCGYRTRFAVQKIDMVM